MMRAVRWLKRRRSGESMRADRATADPAKDMMKRAERSTSARGGHGTIARLLPLDNGAQEIRALDGLRACAALSVVLFHIFLVAAHLSVPQTN
jgi:hypothetical protein